MCGLAGVLNDRGDVAAAVSVMIEAIRHRGPDDGGVWLDDDAGLALGHRRLAVIDTSPSGHQPMLSKDQRFVLVFNGEIYNHLELRKELSASADIHWRGHSDTETLLAGIARWGLQETLRKAAGMFALAVWDRREKSLQLARDRLGEKPLYYGWGCTTFLFGSELKALKAHPDFIGRLCPVALRQYLRFAYVPAPRSIWQGVYKLEPGCILTIKGEVPASAPDQPIRPGERHGNLSISRYWSLAEVTENGHRNLIHNEPEAICALECHLTRAVKRQMISDVPLGAFLSGGIDSSLIVALMQANSTEPVRTFTIGFEEADFDESRYAAAVAAHLGTRHTEIRISPAEARAVIPDMPHLFDEPFADASQIPTYLVCRAARPHVTVALTGDAGDELFGGYKRYQRAPQLWRHFNTIPFGLRRNVGNAMTALPLEWWDLLAQMPGLGRSFPKSQGSAGDRIHRLGARLSTVRSIDDLYRDLISAWTNPQGILRDDGDAADLGLLLDPVPAAGTEHPAARMMFHDALTYLPDDILCKVDRAAMGVSLETRAPLLDPDVIAIAAQLPMSMKIRVGSGKWALRQVLYKHVPRELIDRPKLGFYLPLGQWIRGPLRAWADSLLDPYKLESEGIFQPGPIREIWEQHTAGRRDWSFQLWTILMFQAWADVNLRAQR